MEHRHNFDILFGRDHGIWSQFKRNKQIDYHVFSYVKELFLKSVDNKWLG